MVLRSVFVASLCATTLAWGGVSVADEYRADEFLGLDLTAAVLSPKPLGPAASFTPGPTEVTADRGSSGAHANVEPTVEPRVADRSARAVHPRAQQVRPVAQPRLLARTKFAHHRNPLDAQAFDARIQVWPCKSGGICNWKR
jgi:hypothetical protein